MLTPSSSPALEETVVVPHDGAAAVCSPLANSKDEEPPFPDKRDDLPPPDD